MRNQWRSTSLNKVENGSSTRRTLPILVGCGERQIGMIRRILDVMLVETGVQKRTHELLVTLMSEAAAIVNSRPITSIPSDTDEPLPLTPSSLLTQKTRPLGPLPGKFVSQDLYARRRWRKVQYLAEQFWIR